MTMNTRQEFWKRLDRVRTGLLMVGERHVPMSHYAQADEEAIYFITAAGTPMVEAATSGGTHQYLICSDGEGLYADITGELTLETSREKLDEHWDRLAAAWFDGDKDDPDIRMLRLMPGSAEVWITQNNALSFLYQEAKGNLTDEQPDMGRHETLAF